MFSPGRPNSVRTAFLADGAALRYRMLTLGTSPKVHLINGEADSQERRAQERRNIIKALHRMAAGKILPNAPAFKGVFAFFSEEGDLDCFPQSDGDTLLVDPGARARYWLQKSIGSPDSRRGLTDGADIRAFVEKKIGAGTGFIHGDISGPDPVAVLPVHPGMTLLSRRGGPDRAVINAHFFLMELGDLGCVWDCLGEPFGLLEINGEVIQPPLFGREALVLGEDGAAIIRPRIEDFGLELDGQLYRHGRNARYFCRPECDVTPAGSGWDAVIVNRRVLACCRAGGVPIPSAGFVCRIPSMPERGISRAGFANHPPKKFAVQAGPLLIENGRAETGFTSPFYRGRGPAFPPTTFPLDWNRDRAARMGIGFNGEAPVLLAVEGGGAAGGPSAACGVRTGASLAEMAEIGVECGVRVMVNLDGGGSAQMSVGGKRCLKMSDGFERPVPVGLGFEL